VLMLNALHNMEAACVLKKRVDQASALAWVAVAIAYWCIPSIKGMSGGRNRNNSAAVFTAILAQKKAIQGDRRSAPPRFLSNPDSSKVDSGPSWTLKLQ
jgi:hypothetical protein